MSELDTTHDRAIDLMLGAALTTQPVDNAKAVLILRATNGDAVVRQTILAKRAAWRTWLTVVQREWQSKSRTISDADIERRARARLLADRGRGPFEQPLDPNRIWASEAAALIESVTTRERYVRCA